MEYCSNWDYEQIDVAQNTKCARNDWKGHQEILMFYDPRSPNSITICLTRRRYDNRGVDDDTDGVQYPAHEDAAIYKPASDFVSFE
jgi:hypothetical protein